MTTSARPGHSTPVAVVLAAGSGSRSGSPQPKQLLDLHGSPVFIHAIRPYAALGHRVVIVAGEDVRGQIEAALAEHLPDLDPIVVVGGRTRQLSIVAGIDAIPEDSPADTAVILQNAASPNTREALISSCVQALDHHDAVQAYVPSDATTILHADGELVQLVPRATSGFTVDPTVYRRRLADEIARSIVGGTDAGDTTIDIALRLGARIALVESSVDNRKITLPGDHDRLSRSMRAPDPTTS